MAAITTGKDTSTAMSRKDRKVAFTIDAPTPDASLPIAEHSPFTHEFPTAIEDDETREKGWALPGIGFPNLGTFGTSVAYTVNLVFRVLVSVFRALDTAFDYLKYPLLGLLIFTFIYGHFSDVLPHPIDVVTSTTTMTTSKTTTSTGRSPSVASVSTEIVKPPKGILKSSTAEPIIFFPTLSLVQNLSSTHVPKANVESSTSPSSADIPIGNTAKSPSLANESKLPSATISDRTGKTISTEASSVAKRVPTAARIIPLPESLEEDRTTSVKKRMYQ